MSINPVNVNSDFPNISQNSNLKNVLDVLKEFGTKGHERIEIVNDQGIDILKTYAKPTGLKRLFSAIYKSENRRAGKVTEFIINALEENKNEIEKYKKADANNLLLFSDAFSKMDLLLKTPLSEERLKAKWKELASLVPTVGKITEVYSSAINNLSAVTGQALDIEAKSRQLNRTSEVERNLLIQNAKEERLRLIAEGQAARASSRFQVSNSVDQTTTFTQQLRKSPVPAGEAIFFACRGENGERISIKAHKSILMSYAKSIRPDPVETKAPESKEVKRELSLEDEESPSNEESPKAVEEPNFFDGFFSKTGKFESTNRITMGEEYPASTINMLLDFLYGVPKTYGLTDTEDLLGVLALTHELGLDNMNAQCQGVVKKIFVEYPHAKIFPGMFSLASQKNPQIFESILSEIDYNSLGNLSKEDQAELRTHLNEQYPEIFSMSLEEMQSEGLRNFPRHIIELVGFCYINGIGTEKNVERGLALLEHLVEIKSSVAPRIIKFLLKDNPTPENVQKAKVFLETRVKAGDPGAYAELGWLYFTKLEGNKEENWKKGKALLERGADLGDPKAKLYLARMHKFGWGVRIDLDLVESLYMQAASLGDEDAKVESLTLFSRTRVPLEMLKNAATRGNSSAINCLAELYEFGRNVMLDSAEAFRLYKLAAENDDFPIAQANLAECYEKGIGTTVDLEQAVIWYTKAASMNEKNAQDWLQKRFR